MAEAAAVMPRKCGSVSGTQGLVLRLMLPLLIAGPTCGLSALAFNAPQPIKQSDFLKLNGDESSPFQRPSALRPGQKKPPKVTAPIPAANLTAPQAVPTYTIVQALNEGLLRSPRVGAARAQLEITKALYAEATQMPNPVFIRDEAPIAEQARRVGAQATIQPPWKIAFRLLAAKKQVQQTKLEILNTLWGFRNDLRRSYTEVVVAEETYQTLLDLTDLAHRLQTVTQQRLAAGDVPELDTMKAQLATAQTEIELEQGRRRVIRAKQQLNVMLGGQMDKPIQVSRLPRSNFAGAKSELLPDFERQVPPIRDFIELAEANRLELRILKQQIKVAQAQLYNAIGNIVPDPVIASGDSTAGNPPTGPKLRGVFFSINVELPLYTFSQGDIARLKATIKQYYRQIHSQENQILGQVSEAYNRLMAARERIRVYQERVLAQSENVAHLARRSYEVGQSDITSTLAAQQANVQIRSQYLDAVAAYQQSYTDLEQAVGEPLQ